MQRSSLSGPRCKLQFLLIWRKGFNMRVINVIIVLISFVVGAFIGIRYQGSQQTFKSEEIVGREVMLLEKHKAKPSCEVVMDNRGDWGITSIDDGVIVWRYNADQGLLKKVIVDKNLTSAYEERAFNCLKKSSE